MRISIGIPVLVAAAQAISAQTPTRADSMIVQWATLAEWPRLLDTTRSAGVRYPPMMQTAQVSGVVVIEASIDPSGVVRPTVEVVSSTHDLFLHAVRTAMRDWRFTSSSTNPPASVVRLPVRVQFMLPSSDTLPWTDTTSTVVNAAGIHVVVGSREVASIPGIRFGRADSIGARVAMMLAASQLAAADARSDPAMCFHWDGRGKNVPTDVFKILKAKLPRSRTVTDCPPTYSSMVLRLDASGKPDTALAGHVDPIWVDVSGLRLWTADIAIAHVETTQGTGGTRRICEARRTPDRREWSVACRHETFWVS